MKKCLECHVVLTGPNWQLKKKKYCTKVCLGKANAKRLKGNTFAKGHAPNSTSFQSGMRRGEDNHNWKGGRIKDTRGYIFIKDYDHPRAVRGYIAEHVSIVEKNIGRLLVKGEEVHHINGNKSDNRLENLVVLTKQQHLQEHDKPRNSKGQFNG